MLKKRIIPIQLLLNDRLVKTIQFDHFRDVGHPIKSLKIYNDQSADEIIFLNIDRQERTIEPLLKLLKEASQVCFMPLSVGGGVKTIEDARYLILGGADKVVLNSICYTDPNVITKISGEFGSQSVIVSVDVRNQNSTWTCWSDCGHRQEFILFEDHLSNVVAMGAGEILINSIDRDGTMTGYDLLLLDYVSSRVKIPVIGCGGSGTYSHLKEAFLGSQVDALACGSLFNFGDNNPIRAKAHLSNYGIPFKVV